MGIVIGSCLIAFLNPVHRWAIYTGMASCSSIFAAPALAEGAVPITTFEASFFVQWPRFSSPATLPQCSYINLKACGESPPAFLLRGAWVVLHRALKRFGKFAFSQSSRSRATSLFAKLPIFGLSSFLSELALKCGNASTPG